MSGLRDDLFSEKKRRAPFGPPFYFSRSLNSLLDHELQQIGHAAAVAPFVVVPAHELEEPFVQLDAGTLVEDRRRLAMDEVRAHDFILRVIENALQVRLAR